MIRLAGDWIDRPETRAVFSMLTRAGHRALFVGGCVRDALLEESVGDIDIATDAAPERVMELAEGADLKTAPIGAAHGTITVISGGKPHEVTTFRKDMETDGRRAVVAYTSSVSEDARRRDFTMNALYAEPDGELIDPLGGLVDLRARRVRFIEDARARIREDYLRILRFFRFFAWYGDPRAGLDAEGLDACAELSRGLDGLSRERVGAEMRKLLAASDPAGAMEGMAASGCLARILPGARHDALARLVGLESKAGASPDPIRRLAAMRGDGVAEKLRLSRADARRRDMISDAALGDVEPAELGYRLGRDTARDAMLVRAALAGTLAPEGADKAIARGATARFPLRAKDLASRLDGPALGAALKEAENRWIASGFRLSRKELLD